jgi:intron-binding protein aquarius
MADVQQSQWRHEWDALKRHEVLFLVTVDAHAMSGDEASSFAAQYGVRTVRGCELVDVCDSAGYVVLR